MMRMMRRRKDHLEHEGRKALRNEREVAAGKLCDLVPDLTSLSLDVREKGPELVSDNHYIRRVVVAQAPALFDMPCSNPECVDGGYDFTAEVLAALSARKEHFEGQGACRGLLSALPCTRSLHYSATGVYRKQGIGTEPETQRPRAVVNSG